MRALILWMMAAGSAMAQTGDVVTLEVIDGSTVSYRLPAPKESDAARIARLRAMKMFAAPLSAPKPLPMTTVGEWMDLDPRNDPRTLVNRDGWLTDDDVDFLAKNRPAPGVPARTFRGPAYDPDHYCDRCGRPEYVQSGPGPRPGTHTHTCRNCGNVWYH